MINVSRLVDSIVDNLRAIPELVALMQGRDESIFAYHDLYPDRNSLTLEITKLLPGQMMVAWTGTTPSSGMGYWNHSIKIYARAIEEPSNGAAPDSYYEIVRLVFDGVPAGQSLTMRQIEFLDFCDPMANENVFRSSDIEGIDHFEIDLTFTER